MRPLLLPRPPDMSWAQVYKELANEPDIHAITQRPDAQHTARIMALARQRLPSANSVLDIGCGDGQLLRLMNADLRVGTVISNEEATRLRAEHHDQNIEFQTARAEKLRMNRPFELICAIGVLQHLGTKKAARAALNAMRDTLHDEGHLYVGVLPQIGPAPKRHRSTLRAIGFVHRTSGPARTIGFISHLWKRRHRIGYYEAPRLPQFAMEAAAFTELAKQSGFELLQNWRCSDYAIDDDRKRMDYLFRAC